MTIASLPITLAAAGSAGLINMWLAYRCGRTRGAAGGGLGTLDNDLLLARSRAHTNFAEYTPFVLILIGVIELAEGASYWLATVSVVFMIGRIAQALGMEGSFPKGRQIGTGTAMLALAGLGLYALFLPLRTAPAAPAPVELPAARG